MTWSQVRLILLITMGLLFCVRLSSASFRRRLCFVRTTPRRFHASTSSLASSTRKITFLTDVEGDRDYLNRYINQSKVLQWIDDSRSLYQKSIDFINDSDYLVYGGDVWDQGGSDLYVIRQLLDLKQRYPERVFFILGNRDMNKMRLVCELTARQKHGVYWLKGSGRIGDPDNGLLEVDNQVDHLKWILKSTMGSPRAFNFRKNELEQETGTKVTDQDVVESYLSSCDPDTGEMARYLEHGLLMLRLGEVAFVHGGLPFTSANLKGVPDDTMMWNDLTFAMPFLPPDTRAKDVGVLTIDDWIEALNDFARRKIHLWRNYGGRPPHGADAAWSSRGGYQNETYPYGAILQYGMGWTPDGVENPTVVYNRWSITEASGVRSFLNHNPTFRRHAREFFKRSGLRLMCSGHQPVGEIPSTIRIDDDAFALCADTSYSGDTMRILADGTIQEGDRGTAMSGRGSRAVSEVLIEQEIDSGKVIDVYCHGVLCDGRTYTTKSLFANRSDDLAVGTEAPFDLTGAAPHGGSFWTQAELTDGSKVLAAGKGFDLWTRILDG